MAEEYIDDYRIGVVGGGFAGLMFAMALARLGLDVDLYEEHERVGYPPHCTGLVSRRVVDLIGDVAWGNVVNKYRGLRVGLDDKWVYIEPSGGVYRLDRVKLEHDMLEYFESIGGKPIVGVRVERVEPNGVVYAGSRMTRYDLVILADGYHGRLHKMLGLGYRGSVVYGVNLIYRDALADDAIIVDFDPNLTDRLFAWILKVNDGVLMGTGVRDPLLLRRRMRQLEAKYSAASLYSVYGGPILTGPPASRLYTGRVVVVGDAAGLNKPLTGGGLYPNALAARLASDMVRRGYSPLESVRSGVESVVARLRRQYRIARLLLGNPDAVGLLAEATARSGLAESLRGEIDYDEHELVFRKALKRPVRAVKALYYMLKRPLATLRLVLGLVI